MNVTKGILRTQRFITCFDCIKLTSYLILIIVIILVILLIVIQIFIILIFLIVLIVVILIIVVIFVGEQVIIQTLQL